MKMPTTDLWGNAVPPPLTRPQARALSGIELKERALAQLLATTPESWLDEAMRLLALFCRARVHSGDREQLRFAFEEFRAWAVGCGLPEPRTHHVWGTLPKLARKRGLIEWTGGFSPARSSRTRGHPVRVYRIR